MKKIVIVLLALSFVASVAFAQTAAETPKPVEAKKPISAEHVKTVVGKVVNVAVADPAKGITTGVMTVADDMGKTTTFTVKSTVKVIDAALNAVTLNQLKAGDKVEVKAKADEANAIKVVK